MIDQGPADGAVRCSTVATVDTTCVLPFGPAAETSLVVTRLALADGDPDLRVATPVEGVPGRWRTEQVSKLSSRWKIHGPLPAIDTAITLKPGQRLVLVDPLVTTTATEQDFDPTELEGGGFTLAEVTGGLPVGVRPIGRVDIEPDVDDDGWGDESQDLCRGVPGGTCGAATVKVALAGPGYVPSPERLTWTWSVTNASPTPQPLVVNLTSGEQTPEFSAPAGATCAPNHVGNVLAAWGMARPLSRVLPVPAETEWIASTYWSPGQSLGPYAAAGPGRWHCVLPVLAPGETVSGTIGGRGGTNDDSARLHAGVLVPLQTPATRAASTLSADARPLHRVAGPVPATWRPYEILTGTIGKNGRWPISAKCSGPPTAASCTVSAVAKAPVGGKVLGKAAPVVTKPTSTAKFTVVLSKAGQKWLATHRKSRVDVVVTTSWPGEASAKETDRDTPYLSAAFKRQLAKLAKAGSAKKKAAKKR